MNTDDLITLLAQGVAPVDRRVVAKLLGLATLVGAAGSILIMTTLLGIRRDLAEIALTPLFWAKVAFPLCLMVGSLWTSMRLSRPGSRAGTARWLIAAPILVVWAAAFVVVTAAPVDTRLALVLGHTWRICPFAIAIFSVPGFIAVLRALKDLAPTRPALAGASGGLLAGSTATVAYCLHCPEMGVAFWAVWYLLGMLIPTAVGALLGPRLLRW